MPIDRTIRRWICDVIRAHASLVAVAVRQRAKFEGWLKFELAAYAERQGASDVQVEAGSEDSSGARCDLAFDFHGRHCEVELKTCNTNWRMDGVAKSSRPITKNLAGIVIDGRKLQHCRDQGIVAFCMFPVRTGDDRWAEYLARIGSELGLALSITSHAEHVSVSVAGGHQAEIVVVAFAVPKGSVALSLPNNALHPTAAGGQR